MLKEKTTNYSCVIFKLVVFVDVLVKYMYLPFYESNDGLNKAETAMTKIKQNTNHNLYSTSRYLYVPIKCLWKEIVSSNFRLADHKYIYSLLVLLEK